MNLAQLSKANSLTMELKKIDKKILEAHVNGYSKDANELLEKRFHITELEKLDEVYSDGVEDL